MPYEQICKTSSYDLCKPFLCLDRKGHRPSGQRLSQLSLPPFHTGSNSPILWKTVLLEREIAHASVIIYFCFLHSGIGLTLAQNLSGAEVNMDTT